MMEGHIAIGLKLKKNPVGYPPFHECLMAVTYVTGTLGTSHGSIITLYFYDMDIGPAGSTYLKYRKRHACAF